MTQKKKVGFLCCENHPLLPYLLDRLAELDDLIEPVLLLDRKNLSPKDLTLFQDRTLGAFPSKKLAPYLEKITSLFVDDHNGPDCLSFVKNNSIQLLVNAGTPRLIGKALLDATPYGILNVHPGILPKYKGASCCEWSVYHDDPLGVSAHYMNTFLDSGPLLFSETLSVRKGDSYDAVRVALYHLSHQVCVKAIRKVFMEDLRAARLPEQVPSPVFKPIPDELLAAVKEKLSKGQYQHAH